MRAWMQIATSNQRKQAGMAALAALLLMAAPGCGDEAVDTGMPSDAPESGAAAQAMQAESGEYVEPEVVRYGKNGETLENAKAPHNPHCGEMNGDWFECKIEPVESDTYSGYKFADYESMSDHQKAMCDSLKFKLDKNGKTFDWTTKDGDKKGMGVSARSSPEFCVNRLPLA